MLRLLFLRNGQFNYIQIEILFQVFKGKIAKTMLMTVQVTYVKIVARALTVLTHIAVDVLLTLQATIARLILTNVHPDLQCVKMEQHVRILTEDTRVSV